MCFVNMIVVASEQGVVVGRLIFVEAGDRIDCSAMGTSGKAIPTNTDKVYIITQITLILLIIY